MIHLPFCCPAMHCDSYLALASSVVRTWDPEAIISNWFFRIDSEACDYMLLTFIVETVYNATLSHPGVQIDCSTQSPIFIV